MSFKPQKGHAEFSAATRAVFILSIQLCHVFVSLDNFVRENPCSWQQRLSVQEKSPTDSLLCCTVRLTSTAELNKVLWWESVSHGQAYLLIYFFIL